MLCYRCGSPVPENGESCVTCGLKLAGGAGGARRRQAGVEAPFRPGDVFAGRYAIREVLGAGPVGHVFRVNDQEMDVEVALKVIHPRLVQMPEERTQFALALRAGRKLTHPHHVRVYEEGEEKGRPFFTTQLLEGMSLRKMLEQRVAQGQRFTPREVEPLLAQLAEALDSAHRFGPHSDLKPENIILLPDLLKVTDYGLALGIPRLPFLQAQKAWRASCYVAPEYVDGGELDTRMDLYSLGIIMGELLTGRTPEEGEAPEMLAYEAELPPGLEALYRRAINANPLARPKTAKEFFAEFSAALSGSSPAAPGRPRPKAPLGLTVELALGAVNTRKPLPPVPTTELPSLAPPTVQVPVAGMSTMEVEAARASTMEAPAAFTLEVPRTGAPTEQLPAAAPAPRATREAPAPDATQPMDTAALALLMEAESKPAKRPSAAPRPAPAPRPVPRGPQAAAQAVPRKPAPRAEPPAPRPRSGVGLVLLALVGLGLGAAGGYGLLWKMRQSAQASAAPVAAPGSEEPVLETPQAPAPGAEAVAPVGDCPEGMRRVSGGSFKMGTDTPVQGFDEQPLTPRQVESFCIDEYEYPNQAGKPPRVGVAWEEAKAACEALGKRLCREEEWEKACKGPGNARFPYGAAFDARACNTEDVEGKDRELAPAGAFERCRSGYGLVDLSGNVAEWTATRYENTLDMTQKGGAFDQPEYAARCSSRKRGDPRLGSLTVGFRCCAEVKP
ncbi:MAG TPA: bifunctional serine/threonine-protein kinase/formylglycine-generating enzyme family protein [Myxococcaceae bacterium]|nr:bifunctional serine/threonine-protein kinase/formylglycine-generating enzyme family protein [Myxococcaceae bacterium]